ncbi:MAG: dephospho-CoA kinase, partial [Burkholderiales bacterium]
LGAAVFGNSAELARLEAIVHPAVRAERREFLREHAGAKLVVFDIPLLFEKGAAEEVDEIAVVSAPPDIQRARVLARPGMSAEQFGRILALQMPDAEKRTRADYVIDTATPLAETRAAVARLVDKLSA